MDADPEDIDNFNFDLANPTNPLPPRIFDRFYSLSSSEDEEDNAASSSTYHRRLDNMLQFLDRKLSTSSTSEHPLPIFSASGIFRPPIRGPVSHNRPPALEIRPHPLREHQVGRCLKCITCVDDGEELQLWAGSECGIRVWDLKNDIYGGSESDELEEEGTVRYRQSVSVSAATLCVLGDGSNRVVWSGHEDGRIVCWNMVNFSNKAHANVKRASSNRFEERFSWQAYRGPVLCIAVSSYGDIWSGSENGSLRIWPWESIEKALSMLVGDQHMTSLSIERSFVDLKAQARENILISSMFTSDVKFIISDPATTTNVWVASWEIFSLWDARTRNLLKVFNIDGHIQNLSLESSQENEARVKMGFNQKSQRPFSFFQRSRNAIFGAADAVVRAAVKGAFGDDNMRAEALASTIDGMIWVGCANGVIMQWDGDGNRKQHFQYHSSAVQCLITAGTRIWVGYLSGTVQVLDLSGDMLGQWVAHNSSILDFAVGAGYIFTLANHGGIRAWSITSPGALDGTLCVELEEKEFLYTRLESFKILVGTWNVAQGRASSDSLKIWLGSAASDVDIIVVGLQEVETGAGFLAMSAAKETMGLEGSSVGQWWLDMIGKMLDEGSLFTRIGSRQLAGLLISMWVRSNARQYVGDIDVAAVPCGLGRAIGNKGAVGLRVRVYDRVMCFVNCHFAAHLDAVTRRNEDFDHVYRTIVFTRQPSSTASAGISSTILLHTSSSMGGHPDEEKPELSQADLVVFLGDFNYRLDGISYDEARDFISQRCFNLLIERDQLIAQMRAGNVFQGMQEAIIRFPPTYKFERNVPGLSGYNSSEKKRIPAWCDRILYRDSCSTSSSSCSLGCPVVSTVLEYDASMDVTDSDHKPVRAIFNVEVARVDEAIRRQEFGDIIRSNRRIKYLLEEYGRTPNIILSTNNIILQNQDTSILRITNECKENAAVYQITCEGLTAIEDGISFDHRPRGCFGFPRWLQVNPASGIVEADGTAEIRIHHENYETLEEFVGGMPIDWWCEEDARDKEAMLLVKVSGNYILREGRYHRVRVRCSMIRKSNNLGHESIHQNLLHRSDLDLLSDSCDLIDNFTTSLDRPP